MHLLIKLGKQKMYEIALPFMPFYSVIVLYTQYLEILEFL